MILVKLVLMGLVVYWLSLAWIPKSILHCPRRSIFNFLWGNVGGNHKMHLVDWHTISRPYEFGGWNIKNLDWCSLSLILKSYCMVINGEGIQSHIIKHKYLKNRSVDDWLRLHNFTVQGYSYIWNGFIRSLTWITKYLGWKVGYGKRIRIGVDPMTGLTLLLFFG